jgi:hypothetical protein
MNYSIARRIRDMGQDSAVSIHDIDEFVDDCIAFLRREQDTSPELNFSEEIFELESARQDAILSKYCLTIQP